MKINYQIRERLLRKYDTQNVKNAESKNVSYFFKNFRSINCKFQQRNVYVLMCWKGDRLFFAVRSKIVGKKVSGGGEEK